MKKAFLIFFIAMISSIVSFGQLQEVKGIETKVTTYNGREYSTDGNRSNKWFGYSFYNMNSIPVSVEAELHEVSEKGDKVIDVKTFNLKPNEEYIWKHEDNICFEVNTGHYLNRNEYYWTNSKLEPKGVKEGAVISYYIKYKAYKIL